MDTAQTQSRDVQLNACLVATSSLVAVPLLWGVLAQTIAMAGSVCHDCLVRAHSAFLDVLMFMSGGQMIPV